MAATGSKRTGKEPSLSAQTGHSWKYLYERLGEKRFQQLCGALLLHEDPAVRLYPVGMADGGRDASATREFSQRRADPGFVSASPAPNAAVVAANATRSGPRGAGC